MSEEKTEYEDYKMEEFYGEQFFFSYSSLQKLINDPKVFYRDYILKEREEGDAVALKEGELFHCFILEPELFDQKFVVMTKKVPTAGIKTVVDEVFKTMVKHKIEADPSCAGTFDLTNYRGKILDILEEIDLYQNLTDAKRKDKDGLMLTGDQKRMQKVCTPEAEDYFLMLQEGIPRTIVDMDMVTRAKEKAQLMIANEQVAEWLNPSSIKVDVRKEQELKSKIPGYKFGLKGFIDMIYIDMEKETIKIIDFKTTSKTLKEWHHVFMESKYMYWLQPIIYKELIMQYIPKDSKRTWTLEVYFPVIDKHNNVYVFPVKVSSLREWEIKTKEVLEIAKWHMDTKSFDMPYEFAKGVVTL